MLHSGFPGRKSHMLISNDRFGVRITSSGNIFWATQMVFIEGIPVTILSHQPEQSVQSQNDFEALDPCAQGLNFY